MKTYRVSFDLILDDESNHPRKWVPDAVWTSLRPETGEDCDNWVFEEIPAGISKEEEYLYIAAELNKEAE